jgi:hypothetical protein
MARDRRCLVITPLDDCLCRYPRQQHPDACGKVRVRLFDATTAKTIRL